MRYRSIGYIGTDTPAQCLFIGAALAVSIALLVERAQASGRIGSSERCNSARPAGRRLCAICGLVGAVASIVIWVRVNATTPFPYEGGFFLIGLATAGVIVAYRWCTTQSGSTISVTATDSVYRPHFIWALHLALAHFHLA